MFKILKILLALSVAAWGAVGAFGNFADWSGTIGAVEATTTMSTIEGGSDSWRTIESPAVITLFAVIIPMLKLTTAGLCLLGITRMWATRNDPEGTAFEAAKVPVLAGCSVAILMLFGGWVVIAESWFEMWRSDVLRDVALQSAFRYIGCIGLIAIIIHWRDDQGGQASR